MRSRRDLAGQKFGRWTAMFLISTTGKSIWNCICECGNTGQIHSYNLFNSHSKSCGCLRVEVSSKIGYKHGKAKQKVNNAWHGIKARTTNPNCKEFKWYGARGIKMCQAWMNSFTEFYAYIGDPPSDKHSLDRIDNSKGYEPGNVRWATIEVQANNRRSNRSLSAFGKTLTLAEWSRETGLSASTISQRVNRLGWDAEQALTRPASPLPRKMYA